MLFVCMNGNVWNIMTIDNSTRMGKKIKNNPFWVVVYFLDQIDVVLIVHAAFAFVAGYRHVLLLIFVTDQVC